MNSASLTADVAERAIARSPRPRNRRDASMKRSAVYHASRLKLIALADVLGEARTEFILESARTHAI